MTRWTAIDTDPPNEMFNIVVSENGTRQANLILWRDDGDWRDFEKGYCVKYPDGKTWWPEHTTHWMPYLEGP